MAREVIKCKHCGLNQFLTVSWKCRKCGAWLKSSELPSPYEPISFPAIPYGRFAYVCDDLAKALGLGLRMLRHAFEISQSAMAKITKLQRTYISKLERAETAPTLKHLERYVQFFGLTLSQFLQIVEVIASGVHDELRHSVQA